MLLCCSPPSLLPGKKWDIPGDRSPLLFFFCIPLIPETVDTTDIFSCVCSPSFPRWIHKLCLMKHRSGGCFSRRGTPARVALIPREEVSPPVCLELVAIHQDQLQRLRRVLVPQLKQRRCFTVLHHRWNADGSAGFIILIVFSWLCSQELDYRSSEWPVSGPGGPLLFRAAVLIIKP